MNPYDGSVPLIPFGGPVASGSVNRPIRTLNQNIQYIYQLLEAASIGSTVYAHSQTIEPLAQVGMPVWYNPATSRFERGLAVASAAQSNGVVTTSLSSQVWGIVTQKINATLAEILLFGMAAVDISAAVQGPVLPGTYYLSAVTPGGLVQQKPPISVAVLRATGAGEVFVMPQFIDFLDRHSHYAIQLHCQPAGTVTPPAFGERHAIAEADASLPGWLPASDPSFNGKAPPDAVFGYNIAKQPGLVDLWPPLPVVNSRLEWDKGLDDNVGATGVAATLCVLNNDGIWWMSDCYGDAPWPIDYMTGVSDSLSISLEACPRPLSMAMTLYFTKLDFNTDATAVLSLQSMDPRINVFCVSTPTIPATAGNLGISLNLNLVVVANAAGYQVLKTFNPATGTFAQGPVVEGIYPLSSNVAVTGDLNAPVTIDDVVYTMAQGKVGITVNPADTQEIDVQLVRLDGVEESFYGTPPLMFLEFEAGFDQDYRAKFYIPYDLAIPSPQIALRFTLLGTAAGTLPQLTFSARIVPRPPDGLNTPLTLPADVDEFEVTCTTVAALEDPYQYVEAQSDPFDVSPGDTVFFYVQRTGSTDAYGGSVGVIRHAGIVSSSS